MQGRFKKGDSVSWNAVHGPRSGIIEGEHKLGYLVRLPDGRFTIVHEKSIRNGMEIH